MPCTPAPAAIGLKTWAQFWVGCLLFTLLWDATGADWAVMQWLGDAKGFALRDQWLLSQILHERARQLAQVIFVLLVLMVWWPKGIFKQITGKQRLQIVLGITLTLLAVNLVKRGSLTSCPWELEAFGGTAHYVSHWAWGVGDGGGGMCFPGGHASSAFAFLALTTPWLASPQRSHRRMGLHMTGFILLMGLLLGGAQTLRGAHYPSHTAWTALICAAVAWGHHGLWAWINRRNACVSKAPSDSAS